MVQVHEAAHTIQAVADVAFTSPHTLHTRFKRGEIRVGMTDKAGGPGVAAKLSGHTAMAIVVAEELIRLGVPPKVACDAGIAFGHSGDFPGGFVGDESAGVGRNPGCLFDTIEGETAATVMFVDPTDRGMKVRIKRVKFDTPFFTVFAEGQSDGQVVLILDHLVDSAKARLGIDRE